MSPDKVVEVLNTLGVSITRRTLLNYEKWNIIPKPERGGGGTGGRYTKYTLVGVADIYAAWTLLNGQYGDLSMFQGKLPAFSPEIIYYARKYNSESGKELLVLSEEIFQHMMISPELNDDHKIQQIESQINIRLVSLVLQIWQLQSKKAKMILKIPE